MLRDYFADLLGEVAPIFCFAAEGFIGIRSIHASGLNLLSLVGEMAVNGPLEDKFPGAGRRRSERHAAGG